jgi:hypothetical protein
MSGKETLMLKKMDSCSSRDLQCSIISIHYLGKSRWGGGGGEGIWDKKDSNKKMYIIKCANFSF